MSKLTLLPGPGSLEARPGSAPARTMRSGSMLIALLLGVLAVFGGGVAGAAPLGTINEFPAPGSNPAQVVAGSDGNLWFSDRNGAVGQITTLGTVTRFTSGLNQGSAVRSIAMGTDGNMWFSDPGTTSAVGMINPTTHAISEFSLPAGSMPLGIAAGPDGNVWFTDNGATKAIGMINPTTHVITEFSTGLNTGASPQQGLVAGPDGNLWFTDQTRAIGMINPTTHVITEFSTGLNTGSRPGASIVVGPDDALWFMDGGTTTNAIGRIDPTTHVITEFSAGLNPGAALGRVAVGPDGNLWFGDKGTTKAIYVMNPTTHTIITQYSAGLNVGSLPGGIWSGSDGNVWFTDQGPNQTNPTNPAIGRIGVGVPAASVTAPTVTGSGGVNLPQTCGGDVWSTWAAQQPSHSAYGFDGYQWLLDGSPITGATGQSYTPTNANAGHQLSCKATVTYPLLVVTASATSTAVHIKGAAEQLTDLGAAVAGIGPGASLAGKVSAIQDYVSASDTANACDTLGAFVNEVNAQTGKKISTAQAAPLITQAHNIEAALGC